MLLVALWTVAAFAAAETKFASGSTSAAVTFGPGTVLTQIKSAYATSDTAAGYLKIYARGGAGKRAPTATPTNGATVISILNTGNAYTTNDIVAYVHANGTTDLRTVSENTTTNLTLSSGISVAGAAGDYVYELTQQGQITVGSGNLATAGDYVFATPGDSPLYCVVNATNACAVQITADK